MKATIEIIQKCGCTIRREIKWDARRKLVDGPDGLGGWTTMPPRDYAEMRERWNWISDCTACALREAEALAQGLFSPLPYEGRSVIRAIVRVARRTGGTVSRSPKSLYSLYVTWGTGAWRISDHPWPGERKSLIVEHRAGRYWVARLTPNWLAVEKYEKAQ